MGGLFRDKIILRRDPGLREVYMQYRKDKAGRDISVLSYGCMRFSKGKSGIDVDKAEKEMMLAIENGVNYFDTAYVYPGSEVTLGEILRRNQCRDKIYIASKLPHYLIKSADSMEKKFAEQLTRLGTDHIDYYLMHMLTDIMTWDRLKSIGIEKWIESKLASGAIRNIGFSYHGGSEMFCRLIDAYPWDFCQIQYNYMDENSQAGRKGLQYAASKGIPVIVMEPLRGGKLVDLLPETARIIIAEDPQKRTAAELAFRWLWDQEEVTSVLSGMNSEAMIEENIRVACDATPGSLTDEDQKLISRVKAAINKSIKVNCTGCGYCLPCPKGVDIPGIFRCYNEIYTDGKSTARMEYIQNTALRSTPSHASLCVGCGKCEPHCPQSISIRQELKNAARLLETPNFKIVRFGNKLFHFF